VAVTYSFEGTEVHVEGLRLRRPLVPAILTGPAASTPVPMLVDSGADVSMISLGLAKHLGLDLSRRDSAAGISGGMPVFRSKVGVEIVHAGGTLPRLDVPVWVPTRRGLPPELVLGRGVFFEAYDVTFRLGRGRTGEFVLTPARNR